MSKKRNTKKRKNSAYPGESWSHQEWVRWMAATSLMTGEASGDIKPLDRMEWAALAVSAGAVGPENWSNVEVREAFLVVLDDAMESLRQTAARIEKRMKEEPGYKEELTEKISDKLGVWIGSQ